MKEGEHKYYCEGCGGKFISDKPVCTNEDCVGGRVGIDEPIIRTPKTCTEDLPLFVDVEGFTGVAYGDTHDFEEKETFLATLEVIKCKNCGRESISWERKHPAT